MPQMPGVRIENLPGWSLQERRKADGILGGINEVLQQLAPAGKRKIHKQLAISVQ